MVNNSVGYIKKNKKTIVYVAIIGVILFALFFGGKKGFGLYKDLLKKHEEEKRELVEQSKKREDSLISLAEQNELQANQFEVLWRSQELRNARLYGKLKKMEKSLDVVDTVFISNAKRIARSSDRFYKGNDTIR